METQRLSLDDYAIDDAEEDLAIHGDPEVMRFLGGVQHRTVEELRTYLAKVVRKYAAYGARGLPYGAWAVRERGGDRLVGLALLKPLPDGDGNDTDDIEVGWHLGRFAWGKGYATEFGRALVERGFDRLPIAALNAVVDPGNAASAAVAKRLGMIHRGTTERWYGKRVDHYQITREAWDARCLG